jgi:hypothetical protein
MSDPLSNDCESENSENYSSDLDKQYYENDDVIFDADFLFRNIRELTEPEWGIEPHWVKLKIPKCEPATRRCAHPVVGASSTAEKKGMCLFKLNRSTPQNAQR